MEFCRELYTIAVFGHSRGKLAHVPRALVTRNRVSKMAEMRRLARVDTRFVSTSARSGSFQVEYIVKKKRKKKKIATTVIAIRHKANYVYCNI